MERPERGNRSGRKGRKKVCAFCADKIDRIWLITEEYSRKSEDACPKGRRLFLAELPVPAQNISGS